MCKSLKTVINCLSKWGKSLLNLDKKKKKKKKSKQIDENKISNENIEERERGNLNFFSRKLEKGKNRRANNNAKKNGASMLCPNFTR